MRTVPVTTEFAPAERVPIEVVRRQAAAVADAPLTSAVLNSVLNYVFILNPQRQIVFASRNWEDLLSRKEHLDLLGLRPGEALECIHARQCASGCGTTTFCQECGAIKAILAGLSGRHEMHECRLTRVVDCREEARDFLVYASPFPVNGETYALMAVVDISHEKRRRALERIFFHDVLNTAGGLEALAEMLNEAAPGTLHEDLQLLHDGLRDLHEQVQTQKDLAAAETHELVVKPAAMNPGAVLREVVGLYRNHLLARDRPLALDCPERTEELVTDPTLLKRVLGNLLKNALEASRAGETITAGCADVSEGVRFWVHNPGSMPQEAQLQVFSRSFTTKGLGRGLGTYSVKLLTEQYLKGQVGFTTDAAPGTTFFIELPRRQE